MHKLSPIPILACLLAAPTALAATPRESQPETDRALITSPLGHDPLDGPEAGDRIRAATGDAKRDARRDRRREATSTPSVAGVPGGSAPPHLEAIAACESGGNPRAIGGGGLYRGKYQFSPATWQAVGGSGDPAAAPEPEQDRRAAILYAQSGAGQWPVCGSG